MDPLTITILASISAGFAGLILRYSFRSKCSHIGCCFGLVQIDRDVKTEEECTKMELDHNINNDDITPASAPKYRNNLTN